MIESISNMHEARSITEFDLEKYLEESNDINILVHASFHSDTGTGKYRCLLLYKSHKKYIENTVENVVSPNRTMVYGLLEAVEHINLHHVNVCVISGIYVGFKYASRNKGLYCREVKQIIHILEAQENTVSSIAILNGMREIKSFISKNLYD